MARTGDIWGPGITAPCAPIRGVACGRLAHEEMVSPKLAARVLASRWSEIAALPEGRAASVQGYVDLAPLLITGRHGHYHGRMIGERSDPAASSRGRDSWRTPVRLL